MECLYLIIGPSGSGKTTLAQYLERYYNGHQVKSCTTRPKRNLFDEDHTYISEEEMDRITGSDKEPPVAYTEFSGYRYCVTNEMLDAADFYVIDPAGAHDLYNNYSGDRPLVVLWLDASENVCHHRMIASGRSIEDALDRVGHDKWAFHAINYVDICLTYEDSVYLIDANRSEISVFDSAIDIINGIEYNM